MDEAKPRTANRIQKVLNYRVAVKFLVVAILEMDAHAQLTELTRAKLEDMRDGPF